MRRRQAVALALCGSLVSLAAIEGRARAFDAATTHAALTERAAVASSLGRKLGAALGLGARSLGLFQTLALGGGDARRDELLARLARLDPASGARPDAGSLTALGWLIAGSVVEEAPPIRARNHFFDPSLAAAADHGLDASAFLAAFEFNFYQEGGRFDGTGLSSIAWMTAPANDLSLPRFIEARERAITAATAAERNGAAADALLIAGALLHLVEDAAEPAYVHNDFRIDLFDHRSPFSRFVAERFGRFAPAPAGPARALRHLADAIHSADQTGLADRTAARFYSLGLLAAASGLSGGGATRPAALPALTAGPGSEGYAEDAAHHRLAHFSRYGEQLRWEMDPFCYQDQATVLLPEAGQAALSALEHLFRGGLAFEGNLLANGDLGLGAGHLRVLLEDEGGKRSELASRDLSGVNPGAQLFELPDAAAGRHVLAVFRGVDENGEPIVVAGERPGR